MPPGGETAPASRAFPREHRLLHRSEFDAVFSEGRKIVRPSIVVYVRPRGEGDPPLASRLGVVASRRVGKAHVRNRRRRQVRELFRTHPEALTSPVDVVVILRQGKDTVKFEDLKVEYLAALRRLLPQGPSS